MDIKLQNILNEVVNEVLTEGGENGTVDYGTAKENFLANKQEMDMMNQMKGDGTPIDPAAVKYGLAKQKYLTRDGGSGVEYQEDLNRRKQAADEALENAGGFVDRARLAGLDAWDATKNAAGQAYDTVSQSISDHPYAWGAGALGALGAGAGVLALRKKLRDAKARG